MEDKDKYMYKLGNASYAVAKGKEKHFDSPTPSSYTRCISFTYIIMFLQTKMCHEYTMIYL